MARKKTLKEYQEGDVDSGPVSGTGQAFRRNDGEGDQPVAPTPVTRPETRVEHIRLEALDNNPWQPRATVDPEHVREVADSIAMVGLLQRPLARPVEDGSTELTTSGLYQLAFGHVRVQAVRLLAEEGRWPWPTLAVDVRPLSDREMALIALSENAKRRDTRPLETYRAWRKALEIEGMTQESLAEDLGIGRSTIANALRVLSLPQVVLDRVESGELSVHAAREFLCVQSEDHAHTDIMEAVIREIASTGYGTTPDWRAGNIRRQIADKVGMRLTGEWRHLDTKLTPRRGVHSAYAADFDVSAFRREFGSRVHTIPNDEHQGKERGLEWTCETREWKRWQDRVKTAAQGTMDGVRESKADQEVREALQRDPVARKLTRADVPSETIAQRVIEKRAHLTPDPFPEGKGGEVSHQPAEKGEEHRKLNIRLAQLIQGLQPGTLIWSNLTTTDHAEAVILELGLTRLTADEVHRAVNNYLRGIEEEIAREKASQNQGMTAEVKRELGTRGEPVLNLQTTKQWWHRLNVGQYGGPPSYFPDIKECLERCTIGARYGKTAYDEPRIVCTNAEHYAQKLEQGKQAFAEKVAALREGLAARDRPVMEELEERLDAGAALAVATALFGAGVSLRKVYPDGEQEFAFEPPALTWAREALGLALSTGYHECFSGSDALWRLDKHPEQATHVAAALVVHAIGSQDPKALATVAALLRTAEVEPVEAGGGV